MVLTADGRHPKKWISGNPTVQRAVQAETAFDEEVTSALGLTMTFAFSLVFAPVTVGDFMSPTPLCTSPSVHSSRGLCGDLRTCFVDALI